MGIWRVDRHAPGHPDSPSPIIHCRAPSKLPPRSPLKMKSLSGVNNGRQFLDSMIREGKGYIAVPACGGSLAEAKRA
eukprot:179320-Pelagomonas_calceolata.AAC.1